MAEQVKKILIYVVIAALLLLIGGAVFIAQIQQISDNYFQSIEQEDDEILLNEEGLLTFSYLSEEISALDKIKNILDNFDPEAKLVYCDIPDESNDYVILCSPIIINVTSDELNDITPEDIFDEAFEPVFIDSWTAESFTDAGYDLIDGEPSLVYVSTSKASFTFSNDCWDDDIVTNYLDDPENLNRMLLVRQNSDLRPYDSNQVMIRVAFYIDNDEYNPLVVVCSGG
ncbi:MAG: cell wall metabolism sensor histidine kinase WalK [Candidatus Aenigmarchaeota archaeon]|nr:cell wall metabolism sensor histidine kinase WalK [Candidatus Aenigmarchaeota archaeon]